MIINIPSLPETIKSDLDFVRQRLMNSKHQLALAICTAAGGVSVQCVRFTGKSRQVGSSLNDYVEHLLASIAELPKNFKATIVIHPESKSIDDIHFSVNPITKEDADAFPVWFDGDSLELGLSPFLPLPACDNNLNAGVQVSESPDLALAKELIALGGQEWRGGSNHRFYFNDLETLLGLELQYYKTGNISSAKQDGSKISNSAARKLVAELSTASLWFDMKDHEFHSRIKDVELRDELISKLEEQLSLAVAST